MSRKLRSTQPLHRTQAEVWNDTIVVEDDSTRDAEAFQADLLSLVGEVGNWVVYFHGKRVGTFRTYEDALDRGFKVAGNESFLAKPVPHSFIAALLARFGFSICDSSSFE